jgi:hypothetical protein
MTQNIYFDESGFTGNNLLSSEQAYFTYASVASSDNEAKEIVEYLVYQYKLQGRELKGGNLVKTERGRKAIEDVLCYYSGRIKIFTSEKKFALAGKLYEYIFEPAIAEINAVFYQIGLHRYIANALHREWTTNASGAEAIFSEFERLMREMQEDSLPKLFAASEGSEYSKILAQISEFAQYRADDIREELASLAGTDTGKWVLELTTTSLFRLLAYWGQKHECIDAICDKSGPLRDNQDIFHSMIGNTQNLSMNLNGQVHPISFILIGPLRLEDSLTTHGIQIADAIAAAANYVYSGAEDEFGLRWRDILLKPGIAMGPLPEEHWRMEDRINTRICGLVLDELHARAVSGRDHVDGMIEFVRTSILQCQLEVVKGV